jgi:hypothetical protein
MIYILVSAESYKDLAFKIINICGCHKDCVIEHVITQTSAGDDSTVLNVAIELFKRHNYLTYCS